MNMPLIPLGLFLWFALLFNGGVGTELVNIAFFSSGLFMIVSGVFTLVRKKTHKITELTFVAIAFISYLPMVWQRFAFGSGIDSGGLVFDTIILAYLATLFYLMRLAPADGKATESEDTGT